MADRAGIPSAVPVMEGNTTWRSLDWGKSIPNFWWVWPVVFVAGGLGGLSESTRDFFVGFTFPVLGTGALWVLWTSRHQISSGAWTAIVMCYIIGFTSEWLGVATGLIFGPYVYGSLLGPKLWGVPPLIGLNWVILVWAAYSVWPSTNRAWIGALGVVFMDLILEPGATALGFWTWRQSPEIGDPWSNLVVAPLQNYAAWGVLAWVMLRIMAWQNNGKSIVMPSRSATFYTACMLLYFGILLLGNFLGAFN